MEIGQKVSVKDDEVQKPEQLGVVFTIAQVVGEGDDQFVSLQAPDGTIAEWFRADELQPAAANAGGAPLPEQTGASFSEPATPGGEAPKIPSVPMHPHPVDNTTGKVTTTTSATPGGDLPSKQNETLHKGVHASPDAAVTKTDIGTQDHPLPKTYNPGTNLTRERHMKTFELTDLSGNKVTIGEDAIAAIAERAVPAGSVVISATEVANLRGQVTSLSTQLGVMADAAAAAEKRMRLNEMHNELDRLSKAGKITKVTRDWATEQFGKAETTDLTSFRSWVKMTDQQPTLVKLGYEHGSGLQSDKTEGQEAIDTLQQTAERLAKEKRLPLRDALIMASRLQAESAAAYLDEYRTH